MDTTVLNSTTGNGQINESQKNDQPKGHEAVIAVSGAVLGASGAVIIGKLTDDLQTDDRLLDDETIEVSDNSAKDSDVGNSAPSWAVGNIHVADGVTDSMSFSQAFAAARAEVGAGGAFEWHGTVYSTYTAEEWKAMSSTERAEFNNHFAWNHVNHSSTNVDADVNPAGVNEVEVVSTESTPESNMETQKVSHIEIIDANPEQEIEVLGVVHDSETGANIGGLNVDGQDVFLVDIDGDLEFDVAASDLNNNGQLDDGEAIDIHGAGFTTDHLGGFTDPNDAIQASDDYLASTDDFIISI